MATRKKSKGKIPLFLKVILFPFWLVLVIVFPFFLLIRVSVFMYAQFDLNPWICLATGALFTFILTFIYLNRLTKTFRGKKKNTEGARKFNLRLALVLVGGFIAYTVFFLSGNNAKTTQVKGEYHSVHPLLRTAVGTLAIFDRDLVITDMSRVPEDYQDMGLATKGRSLHYPQSDNYVHALDLRTNDRAEWRNSTLKWYFKLMGFNTLRHIGSGDHLHISLFIHERPGAL